MVENDKSNILINDLELLDIMMNDMRHSSELFQPTRYWKYHENFNLPWLKKVDLNNFRNIRGGGNASFRANSYGKFTFSPENIEKMPPLIKKIGNLFTRLSKYIAQFMFFSPATISSLYNKLRKTRRMLEDLSYYYARLIDKDGVLNKIEDSGLGNPTDIINVNGKKYTLAFLTYFSLYAHIKKFLDFNSISTVLEIGAGYGGQVEVLLKAHEHLKICIIDIAPQLYIAGQYLSACFPNQVYNYRLSRNNKKISKDIFNSYKLIILEPWQLDSLKDIEFDLFWNSASFQEMEPEVVENYAKYIQKFVKRWLYLWNQPKGSAIKKCRQKNVEKQTRLEHYIKFFSNFELIDRCSTFVIPNLKASELYEHMIFKRKSN